MNRFYPTSTKRLSITAALIAGLLFSNSTFAQQNVRNSKPTINPISDYVTRFSPDMRYIELEGITPGDEDDQEVKIDVSTEDKDLIENIGVDLVDNGRAFIYYQLKEGAVGSARIKVVVTDNGVAPASVSRTFHIITEALNHELAPDTVQQAASRLLKAHPNPAVTSTRISFSTPHDEQRVAVELFNVSGAKVRQLFSGSTVANKPYYVDVNSRTLAAGVYMVRLTGQAHSANLRLVVAK